MRASMYGPGGPGTFGVQTPWGRIALGAGAVVVGLGAIYWIVSEMKDKK